jgi:hypothetical protein
MLERIVAIAGILGTGILAFGFGVEIIAGLLGRVAIIDPLRWGHFAKRNHLNFIWVDYQHPVLIEGTFRGRNLRLSIRRDRTHLIPLRLFEMNEVIAELRLRKPSRFRLTFDTYTRGRSADSFIAATSAQEPGLTRTLLSNPLLMDRFLKFRGVSGLILSGDLLSYRNSAIDSLSNTAQIRRFLNSLSDFADLIEELS